MQKIILFTLSILFLFFPNTSAAHVKSMTNVSIFILDNQQYKITIEADILHLMQQQLTGPANDKRMIEQIKQLSMLQFLSAIKSVKENLKENCLIRFDQKLMPITQLNGPSLKEIKTLLNSPVGNEGYPVIYSGIGIMVNDASTIAVKLPAILGDIKLTIAQPQSFLIPTNQQSADIVLSRLAQTSMPLDEKLSTIITYLYQGYIHIVPKGLDHILFVLALFLLSSKFSNLLWQVSVFTLAHTITLALGIFGVITLPSYIVEPIIALSIAFVALQNIYFNQLPKSRLWVIFIFGLLHGLGFAAVLLDLGLAKDQYIVSLIAFNLGVEAGQISVLVIAFFTLYFFMKKPWYKKIIVLPLNLTIAAIGGYWFIERILF